MPHPNGKSVAAHRHWNEHSQFNQATRIEDETTQSADEAAPGETSSSVTVSGEIAPGEAVPVNDAPRPDVTRPDASRSDALRSDALHSSEFDDCVPLLSESEAVTECFRVFCESVADSAVILLDKKGRVTSWNIGAERLFGYSAPQIHGEHYSLFFAPEDSIQRNPEKALRVASRRGNLELQGWHIRADSRKFWARTLLIVRRDDARLLQGYAVVTQALHTAESETQSEYSQGEHSKNEARNARSLGLILDRVIQQIQDPIFVKDLRGQYIMVNDAAARVMGYDAEQLIGKTCYDVLPPAIAEALTRNDEAVIQSCRPQEFEETLVKGPVSRIFLSSKAPLLNAAGRVIGIIGIARDITQRHYAERRLRENEERYRWLTRNASDMIARHDHLGYFMDVSSACQVVTGYMPGSLIGHALATFVHEDDVSKVEQAVRDCSELQKPLTVIYRWRNLDRTTRWLETTFSSINSREQNSNFSSEDREISTVTRDITWRRHIEEEREQLLAREQNALREAGDVIHRLKQIQQITDAALTHLRPESIVVELLYRICQLLVADEANVWLLEENGRFLTRHMTWPPDENAARTRMALGHGTAGRVAQSKSALLLHDVAAQETGNLFQSAPRHSAIALPLMVEDRVIGVIEVLSTQMQQFREQDLHLLQLVADRCATTIERARLFKAVKASQEELQALSRRLMTVQEEERRHIARELHDDIGQHLTLAKLQLQSAQKSIEDGNNTEECLRESIETVDKAIGQVRQLARNLRPSVLDDLGLSMALQSHFERHAIPAGLQLKVAMEFLNQRAPSEIEIACFRIAQEALTNIVRHARAKSVSLSLRQQHSYLHLTVEDDGVGFDIAQLRQTEPGRRGIGLVNIEERVHLAGGRLQIRSQIGKGTKIHARFPLAEKPRRHKSRRHFAGSEAWTTKPFEERYDSLP